MAKLSKLQYFSILRRSLGEVRKQVQKSDTVPFRGRALMLMRRHPQPAPPCRGSTPPAKPLGRRAALREPIRRRVAGLHADGLPRGPRLGQPPALSSRVPRQRAVRAARESLQRECRRVRLLRCRLGSRPTARRVPDE